MSQVNESFFKQHDEEGGSRRILKSWNLKLVGLLAISWSLFQLWYASPLPFLLDFGKFIDVPARAIHLAFGMGLCFLAYPTLKSKRNSPINSYDFVLALISLVATFYLVIEYEGLVYRQGILASVDFFGLKIINRFFKFKTNHFWCIPCQFNQAITPYLSEFLHVWYLVSL